MEYGAIKLVTHLWPVFLCLIFVKTTILYVVNILKLRIQFMSLILKIDSSLLKDYSCFPDRRTEDCGEGAESTTGICKVKESRQINVTLLKNYKS